MAEVQEKRRRRCGTKSTHEKAEADEETQSLPELADGPWDVPKWRQKYLERREYGIFRGELCLTDRKIGCKHRYYFIESPTHSPMHPTPPLHATFLPNPNPNYSKKPTPSPECLQIPFSITCTTTNII